MNANKARSTKRDLIDAVFADKSYGISVKILI